MFRIFEQGHGKGVGLNFQEFVSRFEDIIREHAADDRAIAFAFVFYNFEDDAFKRVLKDEGVFSELNRLASRHVSIFFLDSSSKGGVSRFNKLFLTRLGFISPPAMPCIAFFRVEDDIICGVKVRIISSSITRSFHDLYRAIDEFVSNADEPSEIAPSRGWMKPSAKFVGVEVIRATLREVLTRMMTGGM